VFQKPQGWMIFFIRDIKYEKDDDEKNARNAHVPFHANCPSHGDGDRGFSFHLELPRCKTDRREA
jgi:hypothetical protein